VSFNFVTAVTHLPAFGYTLSKTFSRLFSCCQVCLFFCSCLFVNLFVGLFVGLFVCSYVCTFVHSFICLFVCSLIHCFAISQVSSTAVLATCFNPASICQHPAPPTHKNHIRVVVMIFYSTYIVYAKVLNKVYYTSMQKNVSTKMRNCAGY
jgi:hypothetical protein